MEFLPFSIDRLRDILRLGIAMQQEGDYATVPFDIQKAANSIMSMVVNNPSGFGILAYKDDEAIGMLAGTLSPYFFSNGKLASDYVWYIRPEHRGARTALTMLNIFKSWALENGATEMYMGVTTNISSDRTGKLLEKQGFEHVGGNYRMKLNVST